MGAKSKPKSLDAYSGSELFGMAGAYASGLGLTGETFEDARQEFVLGCLRAVRNAKHKKGIRSFQNQAGKWAVVDFLRREKSAAKLKNLILSAVELADNDRYPR